MHSHNCDNNYSLLDSVAFVHVFHDKDKFTNFRRVTKSQRLFYGTKIITIKSWGEISLTLKIENQISILILKEVAYILTFYLNLVLLDYLENKRYRWHHLSGKICNRNTLQIIGFTSKQGNNYKIGNYKTDIRIALVTLDVLR